MPRRFTTPVTLPGNPTGALEAAPKQYVDLRQLTSEKGANNGYCPLDGSGLVPVSDLPVGTASGTVAAGDHGHDNSAISGIGSTRAVRQVLDASRVNTTAMAATDLTFSGLPDGSQWALDGLVIVNASTASDINIGWGLANVGGRHALFQQGTGATSAAGTTTQASVNGFPTVSVGGVAADIALPVLGFVNVVGGAGIIGLQIGQVVSGATASILRSGSWLRLTRLL